MPIVDEETLVKQAKEKKTASGVLIKLIGDTQVFVGAGEVLYSTFGEALDSLQADRTAKEYKSLGLNESGQTPEQAAQAKKRAELFKKKEELLKQASELDREIANVSTGEKQKKKK